MIPEAKRYYYHIFTRRLFELDHDIEILFRPICHDSPLFSPSLILLSHQTATSFGLHSRTSVRTFLWLSCSELWGSYRTGTALYSVLFCFIELCPIKCILILYFFLSFFFFFVFPICIFSRLPLHSIYVLAQSCIYLSNYSLM